MMMDRLLRKSLAAVFVALLLGPLGFSAAAQTNVAGTVVSDTGEPLAGVQVSLPSLQMGTLTNTDGRYVVQNVPNGAQIMRVELIGFEPQQRRIEAEGTTVTENFTLIETAVELEGLVVTALGISRDERALGYAVQDIQGDDIAEAGSSTNLVTALSGKVSGVLIKNQGVMGGRSDITIRGLASIAGNNQPLFVVDGVPIDNQTEFYESAINRVDYGNAAQDLNPDDIESISVLKGANAAALYGSRASNGVILITTKKGAGADGRLEITASAEALFSTALVSPDWQNIFGGGDRTSSYEFVDGGGGGTGDYIDESWGPAMNGQLYNQWTDDPADPDGIVLRPWLPVSYSTRDLFETGVNLTEHFSVAGSTGQANGRLSATQVNAGGQSPYHEIDRTQLSIAAGVQPIESLRVQGSASYVKSGGKNRPLNDGGSLNSAPYQFLWWQRSTETQMTRRAYEQWLIDGTEHDVDGGRGIPRNWNHNYWDNIYFVMAEAGNKDTRDRFIGNVDVDYQFNNWLSASTRVGTDWYEHRRKNVFPMFSHDYKFGAFIDQTIFRQETNFDVVLTGQGDISDDFNVSIRAGGNRRANDSNRHSIETERLIIPGLYTPQNSAVPPTVDNWITEKRVYSLYGLGSLSFRNYAFLDVTARNDWSSSLPEGKNSYFYPSVSASVVLTDAFEWDGGGVIDYAKLRGSWAEVGSDADPYQTSAVMTQLQTFQGAPGFIPSNRLPAINLQPEITTSWEVGADIRFADNRATLDLTYYDTKTRDQILSVPISTTSGFASQVINAGEVQNKGVEVLLTTEVLRGTGLQWDMTLNWAANRSEVLALHESLDRIVLGSYTVTYEARPGQPYGVVYGEDFRRDANGTPVVNSRGFPLRSSEFVALCPGRRPNVRCAEGEYATSEPDWIGGIRNDFRFGLLQLSVLLDVRWGGVIFGGTERLADRDGLSLESGHYGGRLDGVTIDEFKNFTERRTDVVGVKMLGVKEDGTPNDIYTDAKNFWNQYRNLESPYLHRATFGKLREVKLSFDLTPNVLEKLPFSTGRITLVGRNLALFTAIPHIDPESDGNAFIDRHARGLEYLSAPSDRTFGINFTVTR